MTLSHAAPERPMRLRPRSVRGRIWVLTVAVLALLAVLALIVGDAVGHAHRGLRIIGRGAGPTVTATGDLYFALTDMDAQLSQILLMGRDEGLGEGAAEARRRYDTDWDNAGRTLLSAAELPSADGETRRMAYDVLQALGRYRQNAGYAILLNAQSGHRAGPPPANVLGYYTAATTLMRERILPQAYNIPLANGAVVRRSYATERADVRDGRAAVLVCGALLLALLILLQGYLAREFRRMANLGLAVASAGVVVGVIVSMSVLTDEASLLATAKRDGFDAVLALSRTRAISMTASADETRYLLSPESADTSQSRFLEESQTLLYVSPGGPDSVISLAGYQARLPAVDRTPSGPSLLGAEAAIRTVRGKGTAMEQVLAAYARWQRADSRMRGLTGDAAIAALLDGRPGGVWGDFQAYDKAVQRLSVFHRNEFRRAVNKGEHRLAGWGAGLPSAVALLSALILLGVRPRLTEYR